VRQPSGCGALAAKAGNDLGCGLDLASAHILIPQRKNFQQGQCFLRLFERSDILQDSLRLAVLGDDHQFTALCEVGENLCSVGLEIADGLDV
jgi:hypothetical protein